MKRKQANTPARATLAALAAAISSSDKKATSFQINKREVVARLAENRAFETASRACAYRRKVK